MSALLCADNPDSVAWCQAVKDAWPLDAPQPLWWDGSSDTVNDALKTWRDQAAGINPQTRCLPRLFGATSRAYGTRALMQLMAEPIRSQVFVAQDYWGDTLAPPTEARATALAQPVTYLVRDALAAQMTAARLSVPARIEVVGSANLARLEHIDITAERTRLRGCWPRSRQAVLWLGQAPPAQGAYLRVVRDVARTLAARQGTLLLHRPHNRQTPEQAQQESVLWQAAGMAQVDASDGPLASWLVAADLVVTCFSNGAAEGVHINRVASEPINRSLFALTDPELQAYHTQHSGLGQPPMASLGLAICVLDNKALPAALDAALDREHLQAFWEGPLRKLVPGTEAARKIAQHLNAPQSQATT